MTQNFSLSRASTLLAGLIVAIWLTGCAAVKLPASAASAQNIEKLRSSAIAPAQLGVFKLATGKNPEMDRVLGGMRGSTVSPTNGSFALQLRDELAAELKAAGLLDEKANTIISGQLTDSMVDAAMSLGKGRLAAEITVTRSGQTVFKKELVAERTWESSFVGAVAIPAAMNNYSALYKDLVSKLIDDPEFRLAMRRQ
jgi:hypothetical protein